MGRRKALNGVSLEKRVLQILDEVKAVDPVLMDVGSISGFADAMIVVQEPLRDTSDQCMMRLFHPSKRWKLFYWVLRVRSLMIGSL